MHLINDEDKNKIWAALSFIKRAENNIKRNQCPIYNLEGARLNLESIVLSLPDEVKQAEMELREIQREMLK